MASPSHRRLFSLRAGEENRTDIQLACNGGIVSIMSQRAWFRRSVVELFFENSKKRKRRLKPWPTESLLLSNY